MCMLRVYQDILVEEDPGTDDKLEDVLQSLHGLQQLLCQLLSVVHVVLQDFGQLPANTVIHSCCSSQNRGGGGLLLKCPCMGGS